MELQKREFTTPNKENADFNAAKALMEAFQGSLELDGHKNSALIGHGQASPMMSKVLRKIGES